jgi:hypothetical protein
MQWNGRPIDIIIASEFIIVVGGGGRHGHWILWVLVKTMERRSRHFLPAALSFHLYPKLPRDTHLTETKGPRRLSPIVESRAFIHPSFTDAIVNIMG